MFFLGHFLQIKQHRSNTDIIFDLFGDENWGGGRLRNSVLLPGIALQGRRRETSNCLPVEDFISKQTTSRVSLYRFLWLNVIKLIDWIHVNLNVARGWATKPLTMFEKLRSKTKNLPYKDRFFYMFMVLKASTAVDRQTTAIYLQLMLLVNKMCIS